MQSDIFSGDVVVMEFIHASKVTYLYREVMTKEPLLEHYRFSTVPVKGGGKMNIYYQ